MTFVVNRSIVCILQERTTHDRSHEYAVVIIKGRIHVVIATDAARDSSPTYAVNGLEVGVFLQAAPINRGIVYITLPISESRTCIASVFS